MKDIAKLAGVSQATVSRVLNGSAGVNPEKRARVMEWVRKMDFSPNATARTLAAHRSHLIGVVLPDLMNPYFTGILAKVEQYSAHNGYNIIIANSAGDQMREREIVKSLRNRQVDGILIGFSSFEAPMIKELLSNSVNTVVMTQDHAGLDCVSVSHTRGGALVASHFLSQGIEEFAYFGPEKDEKYSGFHTMLTNSGVSEEHINLIGNEDWWLSLLERGFTSAKQYLQNHKPKKRIGIMAVNDPFALGVVHAAQELGFSIPDEISVVGFDDTYICQNVRPTLSSVFQPVEEIGRLSVDMLLRKIHKHAPAEEQHIILEPRFVRRETS